MGRRGSGRAAAVVAALTATSAFAEGSEPTDPTAAPTVDPGASIDDTAPSSPASAPEPVPSTEATVTAGTTAPANADAAPSTKPPVPDADGDGFHDDIDECPNIPEAMNGFDDDDGCPDTAPLPGAFWPSAPEPRPQPPPMVELCRDGGKLAGGITLLVLGAGNLLFGGVIITYGAMGREGEGGSSDSRPGTNDPLDFGIGAMAFGAALTASGIALTVVGADKKPCSEVACAETRAVSFLPTPTGGALRGSF